MSGIEIILCNCLLIVDVNKILFKPIFKPLYKIIQTHWFHSICMAQKHLTQDPRPFSLIKSLALLNIFMHRLKNYFICSKFKL